MKKKERNIILNKNIIAHWNFNSKDYFIVNKKDYENTNTKEHFSLEEFFKKISLYDPSFLISIRDGDIIVDKLKLVISVKESLKAGYLFGTKESLLLKLEKIETSLKDCQVIKIEVLSNIYNSLVEISQAFFLSKGHNMPAPKMIPEYLRKYFKKEGMDDKTIDYCENIIKYYKAVEKKHILKIEGKTLDHLQSQLKFYKKRVLSLMNEKNGSL
ncbi:MAG: hypothetical protein QW273_03410 [Candidatus Pacearchaeota archaeon]